MPIPTTDFYSQVPSLEKLSDKERRRLIWQATAKRGDAIWVVPLMVAVLATAAWLVVGWRFMIIVNKAIGGPAAAPSPTAVAAAAFGGPAPAGTTLPPALRSILLGLGLIVFIFAWLISRRVMVLRTVRRLMNRVSCPACEFCLLGLKPAGAYVTCPECGERINLYENNLTPEDLLLESDRKKPLPGAGPYGAYKVPAKPKSAKPPSARTR
jgi:hypothetical protein